MTLDPTSAKAVALFNPAISTPGFRQPIFSGQPGDNCSYVQLYSHPSRLDRFTAISWPDRDFDYLPHPIGVEVGGPTLWAFAFEPEDLLVSTWPEFKSAMQTRLDDPSLADRPLLAYDIVETLGLEQRKPEVFSRAYRAYLSLSRDGADRWRNREILEPALAKVVMKLGLRPSPGDETMPRSESLHAPLLRARIAGDRVLVEVEGIVERRAHEAFQHEYEMLAERYPDIFPAKAHVIAAPRASMEGPVYARPVKIRVILVGRLREADVNHDHWRSVGVEVRDIIHADRNAGPAPALTIILGAHGDWKSMIEAARELEQRPALILSLSTTAPLLVSSVEFQEQSSLPTMSFFAPYATSKLARRDPVKPVEALLEIFLREAKLPTEFNAAAIFKARHMLFMRESLSDLFESCCRLAARALKAGARVGGDAHLYFQGPMLDVEVAPSIVGTVFSRLTRDPAPFDGPRPALMMVVERMTPERLGDSWSNLVEGTRRLFVAAGWKVSEGDGPNFEVEDPERRFSVLVVENRLDIPREDPMASAPGLTAAPLLVIHTSTRREQLLIGNRGQYFHASIDDIGMMRPGTQWVWPILRRQLFDGNYRNSQAALRLAASLIGYSIRRGHIRSGIPEIELNKLLELVEAADCERFLRFSASRPRSGNIGLVQMLHGFEGLSGQLQIGLTIDDGGPEIFFSETTFDELPLDLP